MRQTPLLPTSGSTEVRLPCTHHKPLRTPPPPRVPPPPFSRSLPAVIEGMDVVYKVEGVGSSSGKTSAKVTIADSGELKE